MQRGAGSTTPWQSYRKHHCAEKVGKRKHVDAGITSPDKGMQKIYTVKENKISHIVKESQGWGNIGAKSKRNVKEQDLLIPFCIHGYHTGKFKYTYNQTFLLYT